MEGDSYITFFWDDLNINEYYWKVRKLKEAAYILNGQIYVGQVWISMCCGHFPEGIHAYVTRIAEYRITCVAHFSRSGLIIIGIFATIHFSKFYIPSR